MRRPAVLLLLAALAAAQEDPLKRVADPRAISLAPVERSLFGKLDEDQRLRAKGLDPATWLRPPESASGEARSLGDQYDLHAGFQYEDRLAVKRRIALRMLDGKSAPPLGVLIDRMGQEWARFEEPIARLEGDLRRSAPKGHFLAKADEFQAWRERNKSRFGRLQELLALRRSELDFLDWFAREVGTRSGKDAADALAKGLASASPRVRVLCAEAIAEGASGADALREAVAREPDAPVAARMAAALVRADAAAPAAALEDPRWQVRSAAIEALGRLATPESKDLLRGRLLLEDGRLADDIRAALGADAPPGRGARVDFFGIPTSSRRVVFCLDISPSMAFPFDPRNAPIPRFEMARRELQRTLEGMAEDVRFGIVTFHGRPERWRPGLVAATPENRAAARALLDEITFTTGGTNAFDAILECLDGIDPPAEPFDADTVYVLSDGSPTMGPVVDPHEVVAELAVRMRGRRVVVHAIGISTDQNGELLANLARTTGGRYVDFRE